MAAIPEILVRRELHRNRFMALSEEDLLLPDGGRYTYYQVEMAQDAVLVVPVLPDGRLVLERIYRHPHRAHLIEFPAGGIEPGEDPIAAAARELEEETGFQARRLRRLGGCAALPGLVRLGVHVVLAEEVAPTGSPRREAMELIEIEIMGLDEARAAAHGPEASSFLVLGLAFYGGLG